MSQLNEFQVWLVTGSQHLYGTETLQSVRQHAREIAEYLDARATIPVPIKYEGVVTSSSEIAEVLERANTEQRCIGVITWMHTFSPAKMWIRGLKLLRKPILHLHTQYNQEIPWDTIDMGFMNENQSAHGGREFGFLMSRMKKARKIVVGHWKDDQVILKIGNWTRVAAGWEALTSTKVARFGDNMRDVAVTEGDKVEAQLKFGFSVDGFGMSDLESFIENISEAEVLHLISEYQDHYHMTSSTLKSQSLKDAARIELGLRAFLSQGSYHAFTDTFENLGRLKQLPGIAVQRLMAEGYGFGAEGDWKTAALLRAVKAMDRDLEGGSSFMEDYTYHFKRDGSCVLGAHMLEICPSIAAEKPSCEVHPLSIGGKEDPVRLIFDVAPGPAINVSLVDMGNRFRLIINEVEVLPPEDMPALPVARVLWDPKPNLKTAAHAWILAGGAHHSVFSKSITADFIEDFAEMAGVEVIVIDEKTTIRDWKDKLRWNEMYYHRSPF